MNEELRGLPFGSYVITAVLEQDEHGCPIRAVVKHLDSGIAEAVRIDCLAVKGWRMIDGRGAA